MSFKEFNINTTGVIDLKNVDTNSLIEAFRKDIARKSIVFGLTMNDIDGRSIDFFQKASIKIHISANRISKQGGRELTKPKAIEAYHGFLNSSNFISTIITMKQLEQIKQQTQK